MPGNPLVRFDEGRVGRTRKVSPSLLLYWPNVFFQLVCGSTMISSAVGLGRSPGM